jgi:hypothetical protein
MPRVPPTPALVYVRGDWIRGTVRTCDPTGGGESCTAIVSYGNGTAAVTTGRFPAEQMRHPDGRAGCPAEHEDDTCSGSTPTSDVSHRSRLPTLRWSGADRGDAGV